MLNFFDYNNFEKSKPLVAFIIIEMIIIKIPRIIINIKALYNNFTSIQKPQFLQIPLPISHSLEQCSCKKQIQFPATQTPNFS